MKKFALAALSGALLMGASVLPASAVTVGVSMALFDDNFLTVLRNGMQDYAETQNGVDAADRGRQNDVAKQLDQIQNFIASGVDAIIVNPVDTGATPAMTKLPPRRRSRWSTSTASRSTSTRCPRTRPSSPRTKSNPARSRPRKSAGC